MTTEEVENLKTYHCTVCGFVYREDKGNWMSGIPKGTLFEDLPEDWKCPTCNQPKMAFVLKESQSE